MSIRRLTALAAMALAACGGNGEGPSSSLQIDALSPTSAVAGSGSLQLSVHGSGFTAATVVLWNGQPISTSFQDATNLIAFLGDGELRHPGTDHVAVVDSAAGGASSSVEFTVNNPVPAITGVSPSELAAGQGPVTLTVTGTGIFGYTALRWNGADRPTAFVDGALTIDLSEDDLATPVQGQLVAVNGGPGGGASQPFRVPVLSPRTVTSQRALQLQVTTLLADRARQQVYAAVAAGDAGFSSSVAVIDAANGTILGTTPLPFEANLLVLSNSGLQLFAASTEDPRIVTIDLGTRLVTSTFSVAGFAQYEPSAVGGFAEVPGQPGALAVAIRSLAVTPDHEGYVVFDHGVARPTRIGRGLRTNIIRASDRPGELYGVPENGISALFRLEATAAGIVLAEQVNLPGARGLDFAIESRHLISDAGTEVDLTTGQILRSLNLDRAAFAYDLQANRYYWMIAGVPTIRAYDLQSGLSVGPVTVEGTGTPRDGLVRWATDGFAFRTYTQVILVRTNQSSP